MFLSWVAARGSTARLAALTCRVLRPATLREARPWHRSTSSAAPGERLEVPAIRKIGFSDLADALAKGWDDFSAMPSHAIFLCLIYPLVGIFLIGLAFGYSVLPLLFPLAAGFALIGPVAAVGLYELSRRREAGLDSHWTHAFDVLRSSSLPAIMALGLLLMGIFLVWLGSAQALYQSPVRLPAAAVLRPVHPGRLHHAGRLEADHLGQLHRLPLRGLGADHQRRVVPAAARPRRRRRGGDHHLGARGGGQPGDDGGLGLDRRGAAVDRLAARCSSGLPW